MTLHLPHGKVVANSMSSVWRASWPSERLHHPEQYVGFWLHYPILDGTPGYHWSNLCQLY